MVLAAVEPGNGAARADEAELDRLREPARGALKASCGRCHDHARPTARPEVIKNYDLQEPDWSARVTDVQMDHMVGQLRGLPHAPGKSGHRPEVPRRRARSPLRAGHGAGGRPSGGLEPETMRAPGPTALWRTLVTDTAERADAGARLALEREGVHRLDREAAAVLLTAVLCLTLIQFFGRPGVLETWRHLSTALHLESIMRNLERFLFPEGPQARFHARVFWAAGRALGLLVIPAAVVALVLRRPLADFGLRTRGILPHLRLYLALLGLITPAVVIASYTQPFQATYPFYRLAPGEPLWPNFWLWELLYASQFVGIEFFFAASSSTGSSAGWATPRSGCLWCRTP